MPTTERSEEGGATIIVVEVAKLIFCLKILLSILTQLNYILMTIINIVAMILSIIASIISIVYAFKSVKASKSIVRINMVGNKAYNNGGDGFHIDQ